MAVADPVHARVPIDDETSLAERRSFITDAYRDHRAVMYATARRVCGTDRAAEVTQDVFLRIWENPGLFDSARGSLRGFLVMQTRSKAIDVLRSDIAKYNRDDRHCRLDAGGCGIDAEISRNLDAEQVAAALATLHPEIRDAIVTAFYGGITYREVAELRGVPEGTIKTRIRRGLRQLHAILYTDQVS